MVCPQLWSISNVVGTPGELRLMGVTFEVELLVCGFNSSAFLGWLGW